MKKIKEVFVGKADLPVENFKKNYELNYYIIQHEDIIEDNVCRTYGIRIEKMDDGNVIESEEVKDISSYINVVQELTNKLIQGIVTPVSLKYIVEDYICI